MNDTTTEIDSLCAEQGLPDLSATIARLRERQDQWLGADDWLTTVEVLADFYRRGVEDLVNQILHHPRFQKMESTWRSLHWLVGTYGESDHVRVSVLNVSAVELSDDLEIGYRRSVVFQKIFTERFDTPYGQAIGGDPKAVGYPFGLILGDYYFSVESGQPKPDPERGIRPAADRISLTTLQELAQLARISFCPFACGVAPDVFNLVSMTGIERVNNLAEVFNHPSRTAWNQFRQTDAAKYVALVLPRFLIRTPYQGSTENFVREQDDKGIFIRDRSFYFRERLAGRHDRLCWANGGYALANVALRAFVKYGWFSDIRGFVPGDRGEGGVVSELPHLYCQTDAPGVAPLCPTEIAISENIEGDLSELGFMPLYAYRQTDLFGILSCQSVLQQSEKKSADFQLTTMFNYVMCICRMGHVLKHYMMKYIGGMVEKHQLQMELNSLVREFVTQSPNAESRREKPLSYADVLVSNDPDDPGVYDCHFTFSPHFQFDNVAASISLQTVLRKGE